MVQARGQWKFEEKVLVYMTRDVCPCMRVYLTKEEEEVPTKYDLTKYYRYVTGKSILCYVAYAWDCHSLREAPSAFQSIATRTRSSRLTFARSANSTCRNLQLRT